jgi:hypothetical protein
MSLASVRISLLLASDDPPIESDALQSTFSKFRSFLRFSHIPVVTPMFYQDGDAATEGYIGEFIVPLSHAPRPPLRLVISAWLQQRPGRAVQLRIGESLVVAQSAEQAETFVWRARQLRTS